MSDVHFLSTLIIALIFTIGMAARNITNELGRIADQLFHIRRKMGGDL